MCATIPIAVPPPVTTPCSWKPRSTRNVVLPTQNPEQTALGSCCWTVWSCYIEQAGLCATTTSNRRHDQVSCPDGRIGGRRGQLAPTVIWRVDGQKDKRRPQAPNSGCGSCRWVDCILRAWRDRQLARRRVRRAVMRRGHDQRSPGLILPLQRQICPLLRRRTPPPPAPCCAPCCVPRPLEILVEGS